MRTPWIPALRFTPAGMTEVLKEALLQEVSLTQAIEALKSGEIVIYPTETCYGLGVDFQNSQAIENLFNLKGRQASKPVSLLIANREQLKDIVSEIPPLALRLMEEFFPGPLTLVLPASPKLNMRLHAGSGWIGFRQSPHPLTQKLVEGFGSPITTTSANPSGEASALRVSQIEDYFGDQIIYFLNGGDLPESKASTVVQIKENQVIMLREGAISQKTLEAYY